MVVSFVTEINTMTSLVGRFWWRASRCSTVSDYQFAMISQSKNMGSWLAQRSPYGSLLASMCNCFPTPLAQCMSYLHVTEKRRCEIVSEQTSMKQSWFLTNLTSKEIHGQLRGSWFSPQGSTQAIPPYPSVFPGRLVKSCWTTCPLVNVYGNSHFCTRETHYFDWAMSNNYVSLPDGVQ